MEVLIGSALILVNLGVLSSTLIQYGEVSKKQRIINLAINLESAFHRAVSDPISYTGYVDTMVSGNFPADFDFPVPVDLEGAKVTVLLDWAAIGDTLSIYLNKQMASCANFSDLNCIILFEVAKTGVAPTYSFAYRITINPNIHIAVVPLGVKESGAFTTNRSGNSDYRLYVPQYILASDSFSTCAPATTAALTGYDRLTGSATCLVEPTDIVAERCDTNEIAKGLQVVWDLVNYRIRPRCVAARSFTCPPADSNNDVTAAQLDYSMLVYDPRGLDSNFAIGATNKCVFTAMSPATDPSPPANVGTTLNVAQACPNPYYITNAAPYGCTNGPVTTPVQGRCDECTGGYDTVFPYNCLGWTTRFFDSQSSSLSGTPVILGGNVVGVNCLLSDTTPNPPAAWPGCTAGFVPPTISATITLNATCDLKPGTNMIIDAIIE